MKQIFKFTLPVFALLVLVVFAVAAAGCLGSDADKITYEPAEIASLKVIQDNGTIYATANVTINGGCQSLDKANITAPTPGNFTENVFDVYIPVKVEGDACTLMISWTNETFTVGKVFDLADGTYTVKVNDQTALFSIKSESNKTKVFTIYE
ncbi:hypothetical protein [Methanolapillus ohkumae]|uniref:Uncharacterized protein n=1 Tax=Methanolapillus ohkumae TaxID=3028298 RepID=A0AA96ZW41_9EURY|nr:hypothetical protein MsAm2_12040 [Methanosarcinaceae archaeon Am2]